MTNRRYISQDEYAVLINDDDDDLVQDDELLNEKINEVFTEKQNKRIFDRSRTFIAKMKRS